MPKPFRWSITPEVLLQPKIPKPMHGMAPRVVLGDKWWNKERKAAYASTAYHCIACGVWKHEAQYRRWLEGHEAYEIDYIKGTMLYVGCIPLCHLCHNYIHAGRCKWLLDTNQIPLGKYVAIMQHGERVLRAAGYDPVEKDDHERMIDQATYENKVAKWKNWRLVIGETHYKGLYSSLQEYEEKHNKG